MFAVLQYAVSFKKEKHVVYHLLLPFAVSGFLLYFFFLLKTLLAIELVINNSPQPLTRLTNQHSGATGVKKNNFLGYSLNKYFSGRASGFHIWCLVEYELKHLPSHRRLLLFQLCLFVYCLQSQATKTKAGLKKSTLFYAHITSILDDTRARGFEGVFV